MYAPQSNGKYGVASLQGNYLGLNQFSRKKPQAVKTLQFLTSYSYHYTVALRGLSPGSVPPYPQMFEGIF